jgi:hypothetical protein
LACKVPPILAYLSHKPPRGTGRHGFPCGAGLELQAFPHPCHPGPRASGRPPFQCHRPSHYEWVRQQIREAFPFETSIRYLIHDRDQIFSGLDAFLATFGIEGKATAFRSPWQNGVVERMNQTLRRELLDHVIPLGEGHLRRLIREFLHYYHQDRTHLGLEKDSPQGRPIEQKPVCATRLIALPRCGGLHNRYAWQKAA